MLSRYERSIECKHTEVRFQSFFVRSAHLWNQPSFLLSISIGPIQNCIHSYNVDPLRSTQQASTMSDETRHERPRLGADLCTAGIPKINGIVTFLSLESEPSLRSLCGLEH